MGQHLSRHHKEIDLSKDSTTTKTTQAQPTIPDSYRAQLPDHSPRAKQLTNAVGVCIAADMRPISMVEGAGFKHLMRVAEPRYKLPSRSHITTRVLPALYDKVMAKITEGLSHAELIALTTDGWTSRATQSYITITAHYISDVGDAKCCTSNTPNL